MENVDYTGIEIVAIWRKKTIQQSWWYSDSNSLELLRRTPLGAS